MNDKDKSDIKVKEIKIKSLLTIIESAQVFNVSANSIRNAVKATKIPYFRNGKSIRLHPDDIQKWIDSNFIGDRQLDGTEPKKRAISPPPSKIVADNLIRVTSMGVDRTDYSIRSIGESEMYLCYLPTEESEKFLKLDTAGMLAWIENQVINRRDNGNKKEALAEITNLIDRFTSGDTPINIEVKKSKPRKYEGTRNTTRVFIPAPGIYLLNCGGGYSAISENNKRYMCYLTEAEGEFITKLSPFDALKEIELHVVNRRDARNKALAVEEITRLVREYKGDDKDGNRELRLPVDMEDGHEYNSNTGYISKDSGLLFYSLTNGDMDIINLDLKVTSKLRKDEAVNLTRFLFDVYLKGDMEDAK